MAAVATVGAAPVDVRLPAPRHCSSTSIAGPRRAAAPGRRSWTSNEAYGSRSRRARSRHLGARPLPVDACTAPAPRRQLPGHPDVGHEVARSRPHEVPEQLRLVGCRREPRVVGSQPDEVGRATGLQRADREAERLAAAASGEAQRLRRRHRARVRRQGAGEKGGQAHLVPQVEVVVGRGPIGAEPHPHAAVEERAQRRHAGAELPVRPGAVRHRHVVAGHQVQVLAVQPDGVRREHPSLQHAEVRQQPGGTSPVALLDQCALRRRLGEVDLEERPAALRASAAVAASPSGGTVYTACGPKPTWRRPSRPSARRRRGRPRRGSPATGCPAGRRPRR